MSFDYNEQTDEWFRADLMLDISKNEESLIREIAEAIDSFSIGKLLAKYNDGSEPHRDAMQDLAFVIAEMFLGYLGQGELYDALDIDVEVTEDQVHEMISTTKRCAGWPYLRYMLIGWIRYKCQATSKHDESIYFLNSVDGTDRGWAFPAVALKYAHAW